MCSAMAFCLWATEANSLTRRLAGMFSKLYLSHLTGLRKPANLVDSNSFVRTCRAKLKALQKLQEDEATARGSPDIRRRYVKSCIAKRGMAFKAAYRTSAKGG